MDFWIQTGSPEARDVPGVVYNMPDAITEMYPVDTERMILSWNGVPVSLVYAEDVHVMVDDIALMLERLAEGSDQPVRVRWGPSAFQVEWRITRDGTDLVIDSRWDSLDHGPEDLLNERSRLVVPEAHFRSEWLKVLRLLVDDITVRSVAMENTLIFDAVRDVLAAETTPPTDSAEQTKKSSGKPQAAGSAVEFRRAPDDDEEVGALLWTADADTARLFTGEAALVSRLLDMSSGIQYNAEIYEDTLREFCEEALRRYGNIAQGVERSLTVGFLATALELLHRAGHDVPATELPDQRAAWIALRDQHAQQMPR